MDDDETMAEYYRTIDLVRSVLDRLWAGSGESTVWSPLGSDRR